MKRKNKPATEDANPWANLDQKKSNNDAEINEDSLMQNEDAVKAVTE